jgi:hypothetical protein
MFHSANKFLLTLSLLEIKFQIAIALSERNGTLKPEFIYTHKIIYQFNHVRINEKKINNCIYII